MANVQSTRHVVDHRESPSVGPAPLRLPQAAFGLMWQPLVLHLRNPFRLSYGVSETRRAYWIRLREPETSEASPRLADLAETPDAGWGEAAIPPYYGVSDQAMIAFWEAAGRRADPLPDEPAEIESWVGRAGPAPARCALDLALHDRIARRAGKPLHALLGLPEPPPLPTAFTIAIAEPEEMARLAAAAPYPILKIKLGADAAGDQARLAAVRAARPDARLRVDANAAWSAEDAVERVRSLERYDLEMIEQPTAKDDIAGLGQVQARIGLPVVADESLQSLADLEALAAAGVQGVNLKLQKLGGLAPALTVLGRARALGLRIMLGCMIETSLGVTAMAHLASQAEWLDLDAPLLISNDPFAGLHYGEGATVHAPTRAGIGAVRV